MVYTLIRDSFFGRIAYHLSSTKICLFPEEDPNYVIPNKYLPEDQKSRSVTNEELDESPVSNEYLEAPPVSKEEESRKSSSVDVEIEKEKEKPQASDHVLVEWEGEDDPENPYNWSIKKKVFFISEIMLLTVSVYMGSAVYTPGIEDIMIKFQIGRVVATLPLTLFVIGYGIGPMILSPMSENAVFGRTSIYLVTLFIFFILQIPTALVKNIAGLCILRFISGFFASPALATGGASVGDVVTFPFMPVGIACWAIGAVLGPSLGPMFGSILVVKRDWRWTFWFMGMVAGSSFIILGFFLPETFGKTLLYRKAKRLRKLTGNDKLISQGELENQHLSPKEMAIDILWRPIEITLFEPVVLLINIYIALVYSVIYLWFEAFPIAFYEVKHFTLIEMGISYLCIIIGIGIGAMVYIYHIYYRFTKVILAGKPVEPEVFLPISIVGAVLMPIGIFIFGWTVSPDLHWIGALIGAGIFAAGAFIMFQTLFNYLASSFYRYLASVFAGNDLFRSVIAGSFPLFGDPLYNNLATKKFPVGWGSSVLGFIAVGMITIPVLFYLNGPKLRARSKYAGPGT